MARGDRREEIFRDDRDRSKFLGYLAEGAERYRVKVHCYVPLENHFRLVAMTPESKVRPINSKMCWDHPGLSRDENCGVTPYAQQQFGGPDDSANQRPRRTNTRSFKESNKS
jgi:hypothetical protein